VTVEAGTDEVTDEDVEQDADEDEGGDDEATGFEGCCLEECDMVDVALGRSVSSLELSRSIQGGSGICPKRVGNAVGVVRVEA